MSGGLAPGLAATLGRPDQVRGGGMEGRGSTSVQRMGVGRIFGAGATAAGLSTEAKLGSARGNFSLDTGTISTLMLAGIVVATFAFYSWTRGSQS